jgi:hypothetical protein
VALLLEFLTGQSIQTIAARYHIACPDVEDLIRAALLRHGYAASDHNVRAHDLMMPRDDRQRTSVDAIKKAGSVSRLPELRRLWAFQFVAEELHFGRAANRMAMQQSPLSRIIISLEHDLGFALFVRSRRSVRLTPAGKYLLGQAPFLVASLESTIERAAEIVPTSDRHRIKIARRGVGDPGLGRTTS